MTHEQPSRSLECLQKAVPISLTISALMTICRFVCNITMHDYEFINENIKQFIIHFLYHKYTPTPYTKLMLFSYLSNLTAELGLLLIGFLNKAGRAALPAPLKTLDIHLSRDKRLLHSSQTPAINIRVEKTQPNQTTKPQTQLASEPTHLRSNKH